MDYADNFNPKPIKGEKYTTKDGMIVIVDDIQPDEGIVYVFCHYEGDEPNTMFPNKDEWETMFSSTDTTYRESDSNDTTTGGSNSNDTTAGGSDSNDTTTGGSNSNDTTAGGSDSNDTTTGGSDSNDTTTGGSESNDTTAGGSDSNDTTAGGSDSNDTTTGGSDSNDTTTAGSTQLDSNFDNDFNEYLKKVIEPINRLKKLLQNGITLPFQILKLESDEEIPAQYSDPNVTKTCQDEINKIEALRKEGEKDENRGSWLEEKMWSFGAFDKPMLRMLKQDHGAKTGLGAAIFMTSLLACCTGTYAFYKISDNTFLAFIVGLIWGTMIYVLDRNIVASMAYTGERHKVRQFFKSSCTVGLRLIISIFIGIVISTPIEMLIFSGKIDEFKNFEHEQFIKKEIASYQFEISKDLVEKKTRINEELADVRQRMDWEESNKYAPTRGEKWKTYSNQEAIILQRDKDIQDELDKLPLIYETKRKEFQDKAEKKWKQHEDFFDLSTDLAILYKVTATVEELYKIQERETESSDKTPIEDIAKHNTSVSSSNEQDTSSAENQQAISKNNKQDTSSPSLDDKVEKNIVNPALPKDNTMHYCRIFITIFFILLEVIPVITKLFFKAGDYDKEIVRWTYLKAKLHRIENANSYNQTINGALSKHRKYILGDEFEDIAKTLQSDKNHEIDNNDDIDVTLPIKGCLRTAQDYNDWRNLIRWKFAIKKADDYLEEEINKLFPQMASAQKPPTQPVQPQQPQTFSTPVDPSAGGETID